MNKVGNPRVTFCDSIYTTSSILRVLVVVLCVVRRHACLPRETGESPCRESSSQDVCLARLHCHIDNGQRTKSEQDLRKDIILLSPIDHVVSRRPDQIPPGQPALDDCVTPMRSLQVFFFLDEPRHVALWPGARKQGCPERERLSA